MFQTWNDLLKKNKPDFDREYGESRLWTDLPVQDVLYCKDKMFRFIIKPSKLYVSFLMEWYEAGATSMTTVGRLAIP